MTYVALSPASCSAHRDGQRTKGEEPAAGELPVTHRFGKFRRFGTCSKSGAQPEASARSVLRPGPC